MSFFTSNRERRLWFWVLAVVVAIGVIAVYLMALFRAQSWQERTYLIEYTSLRKARLAGMAWIFKQKGRAACGPTGLDYVEPGLQIWFRSGNR